MNKVVSRDDGHLAVGIIDDTASRSTTVGAGLHMRQGKYLLDHGAVRPYRTREFMIIPKEPTKDSVEVPFNLDGDPHKPSKIHVRCLQRALNVFYIP